MLNELVRKAELAKVGISDPFEAHSKRPLVEHLTDWEAVDRFAIELVGTMVHPAIP